MFLPSILGATLRRLTGGADVTTGEPGDEAIDGDAGNDRLYGAGGNDILSGGEGNDRLTGGTGDDSIAGGNGTDTAVYAEALADVVVTWDAATGSYVIETASGDDVVTGVELFDFAGTVVDAVELRAVRLGSGDDSYTVGPDGGRVLGLAGNDNLSGGAGADQLEGGDGDDTLTGAGGNDTLWGGAGNDTLFAGEGNDTVDGGSGADRLVIAHTTGQSVAITREDDTWIITGPLGRTVARNIESLVLGSDLGTDRLPLLAGLAVSATSLAEGDSGTTDLVARVTLDRPAPAALTLGYAVTAAVDGNGIDAADFEGGLPAGTVTIAAGETTADITIRVRGDTTPEQTEAFRIALVDLPVGVLKGVESVTVTIIDDEARQLTAGADRFSGTSVGDKVDGGAGNDQLRGLDGDDVLAGGIGNDQLDGGNGNDTLSGGAGDDTLIGGSGFDTVTYAAAVSGVAVSLDTTALQATGAEGRDRLLGVEALIGSAHDDTLIGSLIANVLTGGDGADILDGGRGNDTLYGGSGNDTLIGGAGINRLEGGAGNDRYEVEDPRDIIVELAGGGTDHVFAQQSFALADQVENLTLLGLRDISGTGNGLDNEIVGNTRSNTLRGLGGNDVIRGDRGNDDILGGDGNDTLFGDAGLDRLRGEAGNDVLLGLLDNDTLEGGDGDDTLDGGAGRDRLIGGAGNDILIVDDAGDVLVEDTDGGIDTVRAQISWTLGDNLENLVLTDASAVLGTGNALDNTLTGSAGNNLLQGLAGNDTLRGEAGHDVLDGGTGNDVLDGGAGVDTASYAEAAAGVTVSLALSAAQDTGGAGTDTLVAIENLVGSGQSDRLAGDEGANVLTGGAGADRIDGAGGADTVIQFKGDSIAATSAAIQVLDLPDTGVDRLFGNGSTITFGNGVDILTAGGVKSTEGSVVEFNDALVLSGFAADASDGLNGTYTKLYFGPSGGIDAVVTDTVYAGQLIVADGTGWINGVGATPSTAAATFYLQGTLSAGVFTVNAGPSYDGVGGGVDYLVFTVGRAGLGASLASGDFFKTQASAVVVDSVDTFVGTEGNDTLTGTTGADILNGGAGDDLLTGGAGADVFVFADGFGLDRITDFAPGTTGEVIDFAAVTDIVDHADLTANHLGSDADGNAVITVGSNVLTLVGVAKNSLAVDDFLF